MELVQKMHEELKQVLDCYRENTGDMSAVKEKIDAHIVGFMDAAKELETLVTKKEDQDSTDLAKEVEELEAELKRKDELIKKYTQKINEWEETFRNLKEEQLKALHSIL